MRRFGALLVVVQILALLLGQKAFLEQLSATGVFHHLAQAEGWQWLMVVTLASGTGVLIRRRGRRQHNAAASQDVSSD